MLYNLPPNKCLKEWFIFLTLVILGPKKPKKINEYIFASIDGRAEGTVARGTCV
jgi:hypothetical protein